MDYDEKDILHIEVSGYTKKSLLSRAVEAAEMYFGHKKVSVIKLTPTMGKVESNYRDPRDPYTATFAAAEHDA